MIASTKVALASSDVVDSNPSLGPLPFALTPLIGRDAHVTTISERLTSPETRLLTLVGPGGIGKTRLALAAAHLARPFYEDGAQFLRLASVTDPALVPLALARALDLHGSSQERHDWELARDRHCLLVIDNFEQLLEAASSVVEVLSHCPHVTMLITSREPLNVSGEHVYPVPQLTTPLEDAIDLKMISQVDAVRLFVERAVAANPEFRLTNENALAIAHITRQLDGLPLAIELAAARSKHFPPRAIVDRLVAPGDILRGGPVDLSPHQRTIRDTIAWSYDLLDPEEQSLFRALSTFAGGFMSQAAAYVCGAAEHPPPIQLPCAVQVGDYSILDQCSSLSGKNLTFKSEDLQDEPRFAMLLTIRGFAAAELQRHGELDAIRLRHAAWHLEYAKVAAAGIRGPDQTSWLQWLEIEHPNLRLALDYFRERGDLGSFASMAHSLVTFWMVRGHLIEGLRWLRLALGTGKSKPIDRPLRIDLLCAAGWLALRQGLPDDGRAYAEASLSEAHARGHSGQVAAALRLLGDIEDRFANYERATQSMREALILYRETGDLVNVAETLTGLAGISMDTGDYDEAERTFRESVAVATAIGDAIILARALDSLSLTLHVRGESAQAIAYAERALELYRTHGNVRGIAIAMDHVGKYSRALGDPIRAWTCHRESLARRRKVGDPRGMAVWLEAMAGLLASCGEFETTACVLGGVESIRQRGGFPEHTQEKAQLRVTIRRAKARLTPEQFAMAWTRGSRMSLPEIVDLAYNEAERTVTAWSGDEDQPPLQEEAVSLAELGLTAREQEVARLLTLQLSDKDIAGRLAISPRTVSTHVTVILRKLGVHSRRDIARFAGESSPGRVDGSDREP